MKVAVLGDGGWGTTLAIHLHKQGYRVSLWGAFSDYTAVLREKRENVKFLPSIRIPEPVEITSDLSHALTDSGMVVIALPSHVVREVCERISSMMQLKHVVDKAIVLNVSKGIECDTLLRMSGVIKDVLGDVRYAVFSGPSHAEEVARGIPTTVTVSSHDPYVSEQIQKVFMSDTLRVYTNDDVLGVELGGSLKNVIAIAAGICDGLGYGDNAKAALLTRGLAEITRLGVAMGAQRETFAGLAGIGDLITTCISKYGRNRHFGERIAKGETAQDILAHMEMVVEGYRTTASAYKLAEKYRVDMPITRAVYEILYRDKDSRKAVKELMLRTPKPETERLCSKSDS